MDNQHNKTLWDGQTNSDDRPLRRPRQTQNITNDFENLSINLSNTTTTTNEQQTSPSLHVQTENIQNNLTNIISNSRLSVHADEWYPPNFQRPVSSIQNRLSRNKVHESEHQNSPQSNDLETSYICDAAINITRLKEIVNVITYDPGQFESLLDVFMEIVTPHFEEVDTVDALADMIYEQVIRNNRFKLELCNFILSGGWRGKL